MLDLIVFMYALLSCDGKPQSEMVLSSIMYYIHGD